MSTHNSHQVTRTKKRKSHPAPLSLITQFRPRPARRLARSTRSLREGYAWAEDKDHCEEYGRLLAANPSKVSQRAKKRGLPQMGTLGAGNHYAEIQARNRGAGSPPRPTMGFPLLAVLLLSHCTLHTPAFCHSPADSGSACVLRDSHRSPLSSGGGRGV